MARRRWVLAPIVARSAAPPSGVVLRSTTSADDAALAALLDRAYAGTIDFDVDDDHVAELETWRDVDGADDEASWVAVADGAIVGASLIGRELGEPFLYEVAVHPGWDGVGVGRALVSRSCACLADTMADLVAAWVTHGNVRSERLLAGAGFVPVTRAIEQPEAILHYRAAAAAAGISGAVALATAVVDGRPTLWVIAAEAGDLRVVDVRGVEVDVVTVAPDDARVVDVARAAVPIRGAAWLLARQR